MNWLWLIPTGFGSFIVGWFISAVFSSPSHRLQYLQDAYVLKFEECEELKKVKSCSVCDDKFNLQ